MARRSVHPNRIVIPALFLLAALPTLTSVQKSLPVKTGKTKVRDRHFNYMVFKKDVAFLLKERTTKDVWGGLYDFHLIEGEYAEEQVLNKCTQEFGLKNPIIEEISDPFLHVLSHQKIHARFYLLEVSQEDVIRITQKTALNTFSVEEVLNLPKPKLIVNYLEYIGIK